MRRFASNVERRFGKLLLFPRLRHRVWAVEQEYGDLLVGLLADIHRPMNAGARLFPIDLPGPDLNALAVAAIAILNREDVTAQQRPLLDGTDRDATPSLRREQGAGGTPSWFRDGRGFHLSLCVPQIVK